MIKREIAEMQMYTHALRCMIYDFGREYDADPNGKYIERRPPCASCSPSTPPASSPTACWNLQRRQLLRGLPYGPTERLYRDARAMRHGSRRAPNVQRITIARNCQKFGGKVSTSCNPPKGFDRKNKFTYKRTAPYGAVSFIVAKPSITERVRSAA